MNPPDTPESAKDAARRGLPLWAWLALLTAATIALLILVGRGSFAA